MAWWQKKLLRYALSRTGLLDDKALDLDKLDIALGKKNVVELKEVGLNIERVTKLAQLPPSLRIESARVLSLRLTVPADIYQSSIVAEVDGVELSLKLDENSADVLQEQKAKVRSTTTSQNPPHRKVHRRIHSPPPYDPGGSRDFDDLRIPTTEELARSFLLEEPVHNRRALEASVVASDKDLEESTVSDSSDGGTFGTGAAIGLPGFLADFLQGIIDRLQVSVRNIDVKLQTELAGDGDLSTPVTLHLHVGTAGLESVSSDQPNESPNPMKGQAWRQMKLSELSINVLTDAALFSELSEMPSHASPAESRQHNQSPVASRTSRSTQDSVTIDRPGTSSTQISSGSNSMAKMPSSTKVPDEMRESILTIDDDRFADAGEDSPEILGANADLEIQPGDDNISWGSRRSKSSAPIEDLWSSKITEDALPESLLLPSTSKARAQPPKKPLPRAASKRRDISPFSRHFQSPGSWPRLEESPHRDRYHYGPGSWPTVDQSQQSLYQPSTPGPALSTEESVDNKRAALEASIIDAEDFDTPPELANDAPDALAASMLFTHEQAQSMYQSAMGHSSKMHIPGGWASEDGQNESPPPSDVSKPLTLERSKELQEKLKEVNDDLAYGEEPFNTPGNATPRAPTPDLPQALNDNEAARVIQATRQLFLLDRISIFLPSAKDEGDIAESSKPYPSTEQPHNPPQPSMPGAFSMYSELSTSKRQPADFSRHGSGGNLLPTQETPQNHEKSSPLRLEIGTIQAQLDMACGRLLHRLVTKLSSVLVVDSKAPAAVPKTKDTTPATFSLSILDVWIALKESTASLLDPSSFSEPAENLVTIGCRNVEFSTVAESTNVRLGSLVAFLGPSRTLSFNRSQDMTTSVIIDDKTSEIALSVTTKATEQRAVMEIAMEMLPLDLVLDLSGIDETFDSFGGLSGLLEAGNSMLSETGVASLSASPIQAAKGVRFEETSAIVEAGTKLKINARIAGARAILRGSHSSVQLRMSTFRAIYREYGVSATVSRVFVDGPYMMGSDSASVSVDLSTVRMEYLQIAQNSDIERFLSLLTPSNDKYDNDDDILIDTLIRQRKKGGVIRVSAESLRFKCEDLGWLAELALLGDELSRLSAVTKYLPEDERPGILSFVHLKTVEAHAAINERFGALHMAISHFQCAHVGLPALLAFSISDVKASQVGKTTLIHELVPLSGSDNLPMVMGRVFGDEAEPLFKLKLFNVCVEYSVTTLLSITALDENIDAEEMIAELAKSVADLVTARKEYRAHAPLAASDESDQSFKKQKIDVIIHDSAIGLSPRSLPSKAMLTLTDAQVSTLISGPGTTMVEIDFRKAGLFVANEVFSDGSGATLGTRGSPGNPSTKPKITLSLSRHGFVSVGSIMAARILIHVSSPTGSVDKTVDVDVRNHLLLLETCADSTQTLISVFNGLAPPKAPSKQPKYLTEPMTIEDMMASFTGEAFEKPSLRPSSTLFDVDEELEDQPDFLLDNPTLEHEDDLLAESEMTDSLYGPVSGILGVTDEPEDVSEADASASIESLLDDDPFEMTIAPADFKLSDAALLKELKSQAKPAADDKSIELERYEPTDLGLGPAGAIRDLFRSTPGGGAGPRKAGGGMQLVELPFRLRLRDLHIIWNIYDGYDWQKTRDGITAAVEQVEMKTEERRARLRQPATEGDDEESVIGDFLFNSIYIGIPSNPDAQDLRRQINRGIDDLASETESVPASRMSKPSTMNSASSRPMHQRQRRRLKLERSKAHKVAFELKGVSADILVFPEDNADMVSSVDVRVMDMEIFDNVPTSTWRKFLTHMTNEPGTREMSKPMVHLELFNVRTLENFAASEITLHVSVLPLRLHVDQDALDFITRFFEFKDDSAGVPDSATEQPFLQRVEVDTVDLRLDYKPKKVDYGGLRSGHTTEFMNFIILEACNIRLKHAIIYGIKGFEPLHKTLNDIWMPDVKRNQLPTVLAGLAPVRSLVNIGSGVRDVVAIPVREYRKDGRVVRSIQKGAFEFGKTTASELARLGAKVAIGTQTLLKGAEGLLTPTSASPSQSSPSRRYSSGQTWQDPETADEEHESRAISAYANQPLSVLSGLLSARKHLEYDLLTARDALIAVQGEVLESSGPGSAVAAVAKYAPTVILRPIIGTSRAVGTALLGVGNQIDRSNVRRIEDKYKRR